MFKVGDVIFIWDNDKTPYGSLDCGGRRYHNQRVQAPSSYKVVGRTTRIPTRIQIRKLDEVGDRLFNNPNYLYWIDEEDVQTIS